MGKGARPELNIRVVNIVDLVRLQHVSGATRSARAGARF
jgi:phosphoketolase